MWGTINIMGCDYIKNLKVEKGNNRIICDIADGNVTPLTYDNQELYRRRQTFEEKYACLMRDIISRTDSFCKF